MKQRHRQRKLADKFQPGRLFSCSWIQEEGRLRFGAACVRPRARGVFAKLQLVYDREAINVWLEVKTRREGPKGELRARASVNGRRPDRGWR